MGASLAENTSFKVLLSENGQLPSGRSESNELQEVSSQKVSRHRDEARKGDHCSLLGSEMSKQGCHA